MSSRLMIQDAVREQEKARIFIDGVSGSGKTRLSISIASFLSDGGLFGVIDTENRSARKFSGLPPIWGGEPIVPPFFKVVEIGPPFAPERFIEAYDLLVTSGSKAIVIDSATHEWSGIGGVLDIVDQAKSKYGGNQHYAWAEGTPRHNQFLERCVLRNPVHTVVAARQKGIYAEEKDSSGKTRIKKIGTAPVTREMFEFEFDVQIDLELSHNLCVTKSRIPPIDGRYCRVPQETLSMLIDMKEWLDGGAPPSSPRVSDSDLRALAEFAKQRNKVPADVVALVAGEPWRKGVLELTLAELEEVKAALTIGGGE